MTGSSSFRQTAAPNPGPRGLRYAFVRLPPGTAPPAPPGDAGGQAGRYRNRPQTGQCHRRTGAQRTSPEPCHPHRAPNFRLTPRKAGDVQSCGKCRLAATARSSSGSIMPGMPQQGPVRNDALRKRRPRNDDAPARTRLRMLTMINYRPAGRHVNLFWSTSSLFPQVTEWARGELNPHVLSDTRT